MPKDQPLRSEICQRITPTEYSPNILPASRPVPSQSPLTWPRNPSLAGPAAPGRELWSPHWPGPESIPAGNPCLPNQGSATRSRAPRLGPAVPAGDSWVNPPRAHQPPPKPEYDFEVAARVGKPIEGANTIKGKGVCYVRRWESLLGVPIQLKGKSLLCANDQCSMS